MSSRSDVVSGRTDRLTLLLVLHNHQPVGNLPEVFRQTYDSAYLPMVDLLERHPTVRAALHYTGPLLEWLQQEEPSFLMRLEALQASGQVEIMGGALYEPILAVIPDADKQGQLEAMSDRVERLFGRRPTGAWLAERVWEPHLPRYFSRAGLRYTLLDQEHFEKAGLPPESVDGAWLTEDGGELVTLLPGSTDLRYLIPWRGVEEVMAFLWDCRQARKDLLVFADDGEKLGGWPGTHRHCYEDGWLERLCVELERGSEWVTTATPASYLEMSPARRRVYIPSATYPEMEDWSLPPGTQQAVRSTREGAEPAGLEPRFVRLGHWRGFLARYCESNLMLQRGNVISRRVHSLPPGPSKAEALDQLWRGQCNCPYWHGVFGGIYLYHIRHATFGHLVAADHLARAADAAPASYEFADLDADGLEEVRLSTPEQSLFFHPTGGHLLEWDLPDLPLNLLNTLARYHESYSAVPAPAGEVRPRQAFVDHLLTRMATVDDLVHDRWPESKAVSDHPYRLVASADGPQARLTATHPTAHATEPAEDGWRVSKTFTVEAGQPSLAVGYTLEGSATEGADSWLAVEINLALPPGAHALGSLRLGPGAWGLSEAVAQDEVSEAELGAPGLSIALTVDRPAHLIQHPLWSAHRTELGEERVYQGTRLALMWPLPHQAGDVWETNVRVRWSTDGGS